MLSFLAFFSVFSVFSVLAFLAFFSVFSVFTHRILTVYSQYTHRMWWFRAQPKQQLILKYKSPFLTHVTQLSSMVCTL